MKKALHFSAVITMMVVFGLLFTACKKEKSSPIDSGPANVTTDIPLPAPNPNANAGLGSHGGSPTGAPYFLPEGIEIVGAIRGGVMSGKTYQIPSKTSGVPFINKIGSEDYTTYGTGMFVDLYVTFANNSNHGINLCIPGGMLFEDTSHYHQNGVMLQSVYIPMGAGETVNVHLKTYCCNHSLSASTYDAVYEMGPITDYAYLQDVIILMRSKKYPPDDAISQIQSIIWHVTDNGAMTQDQIDYLNSLP